MRVVNGVRYLWNLDRSVIMWASVLAVIILLSLFGPFFLQSPTTQDVANRLAGASASHWFGTDDYGRDILSRVVSAGRVSLAIGASVTVVAVVIGTIVGLLSGYFRSLSAVLMRLMDALMAFPAIVLAIALVVSLSSGLGALSLVIALTVVFVPHVARVVRSRTISLTEQGYVTAARVGGSSHAKILLVHILPNAFAAILVQATVVYASALLADASLSFLGLGVAPPTPTWGNMIADARPYISSAPLFIVVPGLAIVLAVVAFNLVGDGVRAIVDPRSRSTLQLNSVRKLAKRARTRLSA